MTENKKQNRIKYLFFLFSFFLLIAMSNNKAMCSIPNENTGKDFCDAVNYKFMQFGWNTIKCAPNIWETFDYSSKGHPLLYQEFSYNKLDNRGPVNLLLCGVHGDEPSGIYICFHIVKELLFDNSQALRDFRLVVAPLVNPDGFFVNSRQNGNGVDPNRNLPTEDWDRLAQKIWVKNGKDPGKYPGERSGSEIESQFQIYLINKYKPDKIITIHSPLGFLDFDGPGDQKYHNLVRVEQRAKFLGLNIEADTKNFIKLVDFHFFAGSLGNYAGKERKIPTYTIELPSSDPSMAHDYWTALRFALVNALSFEVYDNNESNPFFRDYTPVHQVAHTKRGSVNTRAGSSKTEVKNTFPEMITVNIPERSRVLIIASLLATFIIFQRVILQRKQSSIKSDHADSCTVEPNLPVSVEMTAADLTVQHTGLKKTDLLNLRWEDIDFARDISQTSENMTFDKRTATPRGDIDIRGELQSGKISTEGNVSISGKFTGGEVKAEGKIYVNCEFTGRLEGNEIEIGPHANVRGEIFYKEFTTISKGAKVEVHLCQIGQDRKGENKTQAKMVVDTTLPLKELSYVKLVE
jgi:protein MpaA